MNIELFSSLLILIGLWYWSSAKIIQEQAYHAVRFRCQQLRVQMLDDYVALENINLKRDTHGHLRLIRSYGFEFSSTGNERYQGKIIVSGKNIQAIQMDAYRVSELEIDH